LPNPGIGPFFNGGKDDESGLYHENAEQSRWFINLSNSQPMAEPPEPPGPEVKINQ
jgi:hypothetical protein